MINFETNSIVMEDIQDSITVREYISRAQDQDMASSNEALRPIAVKIGQTLGKMHENSIIHGDLTTSNMLLRGTSPDIELILIDFGLSSFDASAEDKGVDLYVLERAFLSSHPKTQELFSYILEAYKDSINNKKMCKEIIAKLDEIRMRGRKRTMVG